MPVAEEAANVAPERWLGLAASGIQGQAFKSAVDRVLIIVGGLPPKVRFAVVADLRQVSISISAQYDFSHAVRDVRQ